MADAQNKRTWDRMEGETDKAYAAFQAYLHLGPDRSIDAAWHHCNPGAKPERRATSHWYSWSAKFHWVDRSRAYDNHVADRLLSEHEDLRARIVRRSKQAIEKAVDRTYDLLHTAGDLREISSALNSLTQTLQRLQPQGEPKPTPEQLRAGTPSYTDEWLETNNE